MGIREFLFAPPTRNVDMDPVRLREALGHIADALEAVQAQLPQCAEYACQYCGEWSTENCVVHHPLPSLNEVMSHMVMDHWDELANVKMIAMPKVPANGDALEAFAADAIGKVNSMFAEHEDSRPLPREGSDPVSDVEDEPTS